MPDVEVFSQVIGTLSETLFKLIPGDKDEFLRNQLGSLSLLIHYERDKNLICLTGKLEDLNRSKQVLQDKLLNKSHRIENKETDEKSVHEKESVSKDIGSENENLDVNVTEVLQLQENSEDVKKIDNVNNVTSETVNKDVKVTVSQRGRQIKTPAKLKNYDDILLEEDEELDKEGIENIAHSIPKKRTRRKVGRPRKIKESEVLNSTETSKVTEIENLNDANENKESGLTEQKSGNVYLNKGERAKRKANSIFETALLGKKGIKKYYEDRLPFKFFCDICSFKSKRESHFWKHVDLHKQNPDMKLYKCEKCDFIAIRVSVLQRHSLTHIPDNEKILKCSECPHTSNNEVLLKRHLRKHMVKKTKHTCHLCSFSTMFKSKLLKHLDNHLSEERDGISTSESKKGFQCNKCLYSTPHKLNFQRHQRAVHLNQRPHLCDICGMAFKRTDALRIHKEVHKDRSERKLPFVCKMCQKAFKSMAHLKEHMSVHTTVRSFQCHICGQLFKTKQVQQRHLQGVHLKPNWHKCKQCERCFSSKYTLKRHIRQHLDPNNMDLQGQVNCKRVSDIMTNYVKIKQQQTFAETQRQQEIDENATAIQTITISSDQLGEFTQQLQNVSSQLQSAGDIGEVYIQGLDMDSETINIVSIQGEDMTHILTSESNYTEHVPEISTSVDDSQNATIVQDLIPDDDKIYQNLTADQSLHILSDTQSSDASQIRTVFNMPVETFKLSSDQSNSGTESNATNQIINQVNPENEVLNYETVGIQYSAGQGEVIEGESEGHFVQFVAPNGQTYRIKVERGSNV